MHIVSANVSPMQPLPTNGVIQLAFDRLLSPASITRQTFILPVNPPVLPSYDPVTRVVTLKPLAPIPPGQYELHIAAPQSDTDPYGLRAIDGADTLDPPSASVIAFQVTGSGTVTTPPKKDFCVDVAPIFKSGCITAGLCHGGSLPAAGLALTSAMELSATAIGRVANGANTGPHAAPMAPGQVFGLDMPIIDPGTGAAGNPGDSWLVYKLLLAEVPDGGAAAGPAAVQWQPLSGSERSILANLVVGREMPYPATPTSEPAPGLSIADMETISLWIAQGAIVPPACPK